MMKTHTKHLTVNTKKRIDFGSGEAIFYGEFDWQMNKGILIKVLGN